MVSFFTVVRYGSSFYWSLENIKTDALQDNGWDLEGKVMVSPLCKKDLVWWTINVDQFPNPIMPQTPILTLTSDSSLTGWGAAVEGNPRVASGRWSPHRNLNYTLTI